MKEFILNINPFDKGLNPIGKDDPNYFLDGFDVRITESGMESIDFDLSGFLASTDLSALHNIGANYRFPQIFEILGSLYLLSETRLFAINSDNITEISMLDAYTNVVSTAIADGKWHFTYLGNTLYLSNGKSQIFRRGASETWYVENYVNINSVEEYSGHMITAGFDDTYYNARWQEYFNQSFNKITVPTYSMSKTTIAWGAVNAGDLFWLYYPDEAFEGPLSSSQGYDFLKNWLYRGDSGFIDIPELGEVLALKKTGDFLIAYGTKQSVILTFQVDPIPSLSIVRRLPFGIQSRDAIDGDNLTHFIITHKNNLMKVQDGKFESLGFPKKLDTTDFSLTYNNKYDEVYINSPGSCYCYNKGLSNILNAIPSAFEPS